MWINSGPYAMSIDYSSFRFPKSRVRALEKGDKAAKIRLTDRSENAKARKRAEGRCEVCIVLSNVGRKSIAVRCERKDTQTHHLKGGIGRRNRGVSILAEYKLRVCDQCHELITRNILQPTNADHDAYTVKYWRSR